MRLPQWSEFEQNCATRLRQAGWAAAVLGQSGDQGVDILAKKRGVRVVFQCKCYATPVGNSAVQEAYAGRAHSQAHHAAVVGKSGYTRSARDLAGRVGVLLLCPSDLGRADTLFRVPAEVIKRRQVICRCGVMLNLPAGRMGWVVCPKCERRRWRIT